MKKLFGAALALSIAVTALVFVKPAEAATNCSTAQQAAVSEALSSGDTALAAKAASMCNAPCASINTFYLNANLSSRVAALVYDAYKTCLSGNAGGGSTCGSKVFTKVGTPWITGTLAAGYKITARVTSWNPKPTYVFTWYRNGKKFATNKTQISLQKSDIGSRFTVKVTGSLKCYKSRTEASITTSAITKDALTAIKNVHVEILPRQESWGMKESTTVLSLSSKYGKLTFVKDPVWSIEGAYGAWLKNYQGNDEPPLPLSDFWAKDGTYHQICKNGTRYKIGVTLNVGIEGKYSSAEITIPAKEYVCTSNSDRLSTSP